MQQKQSLKSILKSIDNIKEGNLLGSELIISCDYDHKKEVCRTIEERTAFKLVETMYNISDKEYKMFFEESFE